MRGSTIPVYTRLALPAVNMLWSSLGIHAGRGLPFFRLVSVILRITAQPVLLQYLRTVVDGPRNYERPRCGLGRRADSGPARGAALAGYPARTASPPQTDEAQSDSGSCEERSKRPLTWITTTRPEALRRCPAIDPLTDLSNPDLFYARFIIAREHGFSSWRKLKEHIDTSKDNC